MSEHLKDSLPFLRTLTRRPGLPPGDAEYNGKRKQTRREVFLAQMDQVVPWQELLALIKPHYPRQACRAASPMRWRRCCISTFCSRGMH